MRAVAGVPSVRTLSIGLVGVGAVAVIRTMIAVGAGGEHGSIIVSDLGEFAVVAIAALVVLAVVRSFGKGENLRRQWTLIGLGMLTFAIGDAVWAWIEVFMQAEVPYPGLPDLFYVGEYVFVGWALVIAAVAYSRLFDIRAAAGFAVLAGIALLVLLYFGLFQPYILADDSLSTGELVMSIFYPSADVMLLFVPSILLVLVVGRLGGGRLGWPWWFVAAGAIILGMSDAMYSYMSAAETYAAGAAVDYGWMLAHVALAVGASLAVDIARPKESKAVRVAESA